MHKQQIFVVPSMLINVFFHCKSPQYIL
jgi:hypothetical protein